MARRVDVEWHALRAGLKPALRLSAPRGEGAAIAARYEQFGAVARRAVGLIDGPVDLVYVARAGAEAEGLRAAEAPILDGTRLPMDERLAVVGEVGRRLGYPACCIASCCERVARRDRVAEAYAIASDARVPAPRWELNDQLFAIPLRLLSHHPCRYDCAPSLAYARALFAVVYGIDREAALVLRAHMRRALAVDTAGRRAWLHPPAGWAPVGPEDEGFTVEGAIVLEFS